MSVKAVDMVRKIRDKQYEDTKNLSVEEQILYVREKSEELCWDLKNRQGLARDQGR